MKADTKRTELLEECKKLEAAQEKGDVSQQDRLNEVSLFRSHNQQCVQINFSTSFYHFTGVR